MSQVVRPQENAYNLLLREEVRIPKPPRYMSKFRPAVLLERKAVKDAMRTMGPAKVEVASPDKYLKKHSKEPKLSEKSLQSSKGVRESAYAAIKPSVPTRTDNPPMGIHTKRDFTKTTTVVPMKPQPTSVDAKTGHKQRLENSGLVPKYIKKKDFGEVPDYILQRSKEKQRAQEQYNDYVAEQKERGAMKYLSDAERHGVLQGLKKNWDALHQEYQGLSFVIDTLSKKAHKLRLEESMKQLEDDINLIERFKTIYIPSH